MFFPRAGNRLLSSRIWRETLFPIRISVDLLISKVVPLFARSIQSFPPVYRLYCLPTCTRFSATDFIKLFLRVAELLLDGFISFFKFLHMCSMAFFFFYLFSPIYWALPPPRLWQLSPLDLDGFYYNKAALKTPVLTSGIFPLPFRHCLGSL